MEAPTNRLVTNGILISSESRNPGSDRDTQGPRSALLPAATVPEPALTEDAILATLERRDLSSETIEDIGKNETALKSRKVCFSLAAHPAAPRHLALRFIRRFYTFDLMRFALTPSVAADLKRFADALLIARLDSITLGERLTLARRGSNAIAEALLLDKEAQVFHAALDNGRLTEATIVKALARSAAAAAFVSAVCRHSKWSLRREVQIALLRNQHTPPARALEFARFLPVPLLRDVLHASRLPETIKQHLREELKLRR
jgi:hypothetical protein